MKLLYSLFPINRDTRVLDVGGGPFVWTLAEVRPAVTLLDLREPLQKVDWADYLVADGCATGLPDKSFDVVFSNSVIEHVGGIDRQRQFARECMRCGREFFVQTPNRWFPFDTHTLTPIIHWFPKPIFLKLMKFSLRLLISAPSPADVEDFTNMHLLTKREMVELFPGAQIIEEKFCGITNGLIACSGKTQKS
jgi:2-polyprenyl-3-methyl-5-hydroxy-6-metoxy-1,4-benzoquinol methylase